MVLQHLLQGGQADHMVMWGGGKTSSMSRDATFAG